MRRYGLRDDQWDRIKDILPGREGHVGVTAKDNRLFVEAVSIAIGPAFLGGTCRNDLVTRSRFIPDFRAGRRAGYGRSLRDPGRRGGQRIRHDRQNNRARASTQRGGSKKDGEDQAIGRSKGGLSTKIHAMVDALGNPLGFFLTAGQPTILRAPTRCCLRCKPTLVGR